MKEYNWRDERKKYQSGSFGDTPAQPVQQPAPVQPAMENPAGTAGKSGISKITMIMGGILVCAIAVIAVLLLKPSASESAIPGGEPTIGPVDPPYVPPVSPEDTDSMLLQQAEKHKYAIGRVALHLKMKSGEGFIDNIGTAWAFAPDKFATNAHVAYGIRNSKAAVYDMAIQYFIAKKHNINETAVIPFLGQMAQDKAKAEVAEAANYVADNVASLEPIIFINASAGESYSVSHVQVHRNYKRNDTQKNPDVAILTIEGKHRHYFKIAPQSKLNSLKSGQRVAYLGYPSETLITNVNNDDPIATMQSGIISAVSDFDLKDSGARNNQFIRHNLPATGGASGSPIFDKDGDVVALLFGINVFTDIKTETGVLKRIPSAVQINFAVRADLLKGVGKKIPASEFIR